MIKNKVLVAITATLLSLSAVSNANQALDGEVAAPAAVPAVSTNVFDPTYWMTAFTAPDQPVATIGSSFNAAHPGAWMQWIDPKTHLPTHMTFMNPANYAQFMQPQYYMALMKPENMMAWMNPASYQVMMDPQTMSYWMNPASYMHVLDPNMYKETMNPANYLAFMNPATYTGLFGSQTCDPNNPTPGWFGSIC